MTEPVWLGRGPALRLLQLITAALVLLPDEVRIALAHQLVEGLDYSVTADRVRASVAGFPLVDEDLAALADSWLVKAGAVPVVKVNGATRVRVDDLRAYVDNLAQPQEGES